MRSKPVVHYSICKAAFNYYCCVTVILSTWLLVFVFLCCVVVCR
jgi:hypothetical protein